MARAPENLEKLVGQETRKEESWPSRTSASAAGSSQADSSLGSRVPND